MIHKINYCSTVHAWVCESSLLTSVIKTRHMAHINCTTKIFDLPKYLRFSRQSHNQKICNKSCKINKFFDQNYHSFMTLNFDEIHIYTCNPIKSTVLSSPMNIKRLTCKKARKKKFNTKFTWYKWWYFRIGWVFGTNGPIQLTWSGLETRSHASTVRR